MFTQNEEEWKETNELDSSEYRRRMTHEDICHCDDERQFAVQSASQQWQKSTDYCGGFSDYMTLFPLRLWLRNDLKRRNQQRRCHSFKSCYRNLQRYRGYNHSETIQNRRKYLDTTDHQYAKNSENLRTVRVIPMKFVSKLATKDSTDFQVDKASDSNNLPFHYNESRKALDVPYYGPFRARKIKITPSMKFRKTRPMASVSKLATKNSPNFQIDNATDSNDVPIDINESRKASDVPYYGPFRARLLKIVPAIKTKKYRSVKEYYLSEMEYLHEIPNEKSEISENPVIVKETHDKSTDSRIVSDTYDDTISKHICSEFDEIPLFMPTIPKIDDRTNSLSTIAKIDGQTNSLSTIPKIDDGSNSSGLSSAKIFDEFELPKKQLEKNLILNENRHETGHDTLMEGLALLKHRKKEYDENLASNKKKQFEIISKKNSEIGKSLDGKTQQSGIKKIAAYWHKKKFQNNNKLEKYSQKSESSQIDHNLFDKQGDKIISQTISQNVDNTPSIDISNKVNSGESKFIAELRQIRDSLRKISENLELIIGDTSISKNEVISTDIEHKLSPELLPLYSHEILTDYTIQPLVDRKDAKFGTFPASQIFHISGKTENRHEEPDRSLENATTSVERITSAPEESSKKESSLYSGRKRETITAEVYIRNPKNLKPTIINISDSNKKPKKPCWMILKIYESPSRKFDEDVSKQNFDKGIIRIRSDPTISKKFEKLETKNFSETTSNIPSAIADIPKMKQDASERIQTKTLISSDSELQSKMNLTVKTQIDTSIKSKIITSGKCYYSKIII
uniref:Uncharacterized protein n=1 Tax=Onchocerca volvulus TaxID=6282 RepID=A0A2K6VNU8_ONCVO